MPENGCRWVDRKALPCLIIGTAGVAVVLVGAFGFHWQMSIALAAMVLLGAVPLVAAVWMLLLANRRLDNEIQQSCKAGDVGRFAGNVAHDFNNLLAGILGAAEVLETRVGQTGVEREMVDTIISAARQAGQLSSRLLAAAKNGTGATVPFDLHRVGPEMGMGEAGKPESDTQPPLGHGLILLVDDEPVIRALASMVLVQLGYEVILASCGRKGIELYEKERGRIGAVVLDMAMPDLDGLEVLRQLKRINPQVKVAIAAGYIPAELRAELEAAGATAIIEKPYQMNEIGAVLAGVLGTEQHP